MTSFTSTTLFCRHLTFRHGRGSKRSKKTVHLFIAHTVQQHHVQTLGQYNRESSRPKGVYTVRREITLVFTSTELHATLATSLLTHYYGIHGLVYLQTHRQRLSPTSTKRLSP